MARADPAPTSALAAGTMQRSGPMAAPAAPIRKVERAAAKPAEEPLAGCRADPAVPTRRVERVEVPAVPMRAVEVSAGPAESMRAVEARAGPAVSMRRAGAGPAGSTIRVERGTVRVVSTSGGEIDTVPVVSTRRVEWGVGGAVPTWELASTQRRVVVEGRLAGRAGAGPQHRVAQPDRGVRGGPSTTGRPGAPARRMRKGRRVAGRHGTRRRPGQAGVRRAIGQLLRGQLPPDPGPATAELEAPRGRDPAGPEPLGTVTGDSNRRAAGRAPPHRPGGRAAGVGRGPRRQPGQRAAGRRSPKGRPVMGERRSGSTRR
jgi:hypothetical protein